MIGVPRSVYIALAIVLVLFGLYRYGHHVGWVDRDAEMQAEIAKKNEQSREIEQKLNEQINSNATKLQEANNALDEKQSALDRAIRSGRLRLSTPSCVQASSGPATPAGDRDQARSQPDRAPDAAAGADNAERQTLAAIAAIVAQGDRNTAQLNACIEAYNQVRESINGQR